MTLGAFVGLLLMGFAVPAMAQTAEDESPREIRAQRHFVRGMTRAYVDDHKMALEQYEKALRLTPNQAAILSAMAESHEALDDVTTALFYAEQARDQEPVNAHYHHHVARLYLRAGNIDQAVTAYQFLLQRIPQNVEALHALARLQAEKGAYREALSAYETLRDLTSNDPAVLQPMLELYTRLGDLDGMERILLALHTAEPANIAYQRKLGELYVRQERTDEAVTQFEAALAADPSDVETALALADLYRQLDRSEEADALLDQTMSTEAASAEQLIAKATPLASRADTDLEAAQAATRLLRRALEQEPDNPEALLMLGELLYGLGAYADAAATLYQALNQNPRDPQVWVMAASAHLQAGEADQGVEVAEEGLLLFPGYLDLLRVAAYGLMQAFRNDAAIRRFEETLAYLEEVDPGASPQQAELLAALGLLHARTDEVAAADSLYARALAAAPDHPIVLNNYAFGLAERGERLDEALRMAERAVALDPENSSFLDTLGWAYIKLFNLEGADKWIGQALSGKGPGARVFDHYGDVQARLGQFDEARRFWSQALERAPNNQRIQEKLEQQQR